MTKQPEQVLEDNLVKQLVELGYSYVPIADEAELLANLKSQLESITSIPSKTEFEKIVNHLNHGAM